MERELEFYKNIFKDEKINGSAYVGSADPFIIKSNGYYYLTYTCDKGIALLKSFDLIKWEKVNSTSIVGDDEILKYAFAPEIIYSNGYYYFVASPSGNGHYLYRSSNIEGPFIRISDNFQELIDGSFYIDSDEKKYFLRASESGITIKHFNENGNDFALFDDYFNFENTSIGNWTEGPYLLKRYGYYYLTYTGTHFLSDAYRVDYSSGKKMTEKGLTYQDTLLLSTKVSFHSLGHSMTFLGPNLDSYYVAYHNREDDGNRYLNISRLLFSKNGKMIVNGLSEEKNVMFERPTFEKFIQENNFLTDNVISSKTLTIEYNFKGKNSYLVYSYVNKDNYCKCILQENAILFIKHHNEIDKVIDEINLNDKYRLDVLHTIRLQYFKGYLTVYLDNIELIYHKKFILENGKLGFKNNELENAYFAYSYYSEGNSDLFEVKMQDFFISNMEKINGKYVTEIYIDKEGDYIFSLEDNKYENTSIDIDGISLINNNGLFYINNLSQGIHKIRISNVNRTSTIRKIYQEHLEKDLNQDDFIENSNCYSRHLMLKNKIYFENDRQAIITKFDSYNYEFSVDLKLVGNPIDEDRFVGLICNVQNYAKDNEFENAYSLQGYIFAMNSKYIYIIDANFYHSKVLKKIKTSNRSVNLKIKKNNDSILFYIDDKIVYYVIDKINIKGKCGIYMNHASGIFSNIILKQIDKGD